jgi:hypothetical protein
LARRTEYYAVLDANILIRDFWLEGNGLILDTHRFLGHRPAIPQVALDESRERLRDRAESLLANRGEEGGSVGNTRRLLRLFQYFEVPTGEDWNVDELIARWEQRIRTFLDKHDGLVLPVPEKDLSDLVRRSIDRRRPFSRGDRGFRDTLIWLSALELVSEKTRVSFITENTNDFFLEPGLPHPDLTEEAGERTAGLYWKVLFHGSVDHFITHFDSDRSASADALVRALRSNRFGGLDLWDYLSQHLPQLFGGGDILDMVRWAGFAEQLEAPLLSDVEELVALDIARARHLEGDVYRVYCDLAFVGIFDGSIGHNAIDEIVHPNQRRGHDESDPFWTEAVVRAIGTLVAAVDIDVAGRKVVGFYGLPLQHWASYDSLIDDLDEFGPDPFMELPT